jgi:uncharacterized phiE125 gp8 family phage protein
MNILTLTEPAFEPVSLAEVYTHLRLDPDEDSPPGHPDDDMLTTFISASRAQAEKISRRAFVSQRVMLVVEGFPTNKAKSVPLLRPPVISVLSVAYYDADNVLQTVDSANYFVTDDHLPSLQFITTYAYPTVYPSRGSLRIEYTAGYEPESSPPATQADYAANIPAGIKAAVLIGVQLLYDELTPEKRLSLERARDSLLHDYKVYLTP